MIIHNNTLPLLIGTIVWKIIGKNMTKKKNMQNFHEKAPTEIEFLEFMQGEQNIETTDKKIKLKIKKTGQTFQNQEFFFKVNKLPNDPETVLENQLKEKQGIIKTVPKESKVPFEKKCFLYFIDFDKTDNFSCNFTIDGTRFLTVSNLNLSNCTISFIHRAEITFTLCSFTNCKFDVGNNAAIRFNGVKMINSEINSYSSIFYFNDDVFDNSKLYFKHSSLVTSFSDVFQKTCIRILKFSDFKTQRSVFQSDNTFTCEKEATFSMINTSFTGKNNKVDIGETTFEKTCYIKESNIHNLTIQLNKLSIVEIHKCNFTTSNILINNTKKTHIESTIIQSSEVNISQSKCVDFYDVKFIDSIKAILAHKSTFGLHYCKFTNCGFCAILNESHLMALYSNFISSVLNAIEVTSNSQAEMMYCVMLNNKGYDLSIINDSFANITATLFINSHKEMENIRNEDNDEKKIITKIQAIDVMNSSLLIKACFFKRQYVEDVNTCSWETLKPKELPTSKLDLKGELLNVMTVNNAVDKNYPIVIKFCEYNNQLYSTRFIKYPEQPTSFPYYFD